MPIPKSQLEVWSELVPSKSAKEAHESIRSNLKSGLLSIRHETYLQGSYRNSTNIRGSSDVDIVVQLTELIIQDKNLLPHAKQLWQEFRDTVFMLLEDSYKTVRRGRKSIKVETHGFRADVVVSLTYHHYPDPQPWECETPCFVEGIAFFVEGENRWIVNYPKLHYENGVKKNKRTNGLYKPTIRMFKNARKHLEAKGSLSRPVPSYFLECLLYNVPDDRYRPDLQDTFRGVVEWLDQTSRNSSRFNYLLCQNEVDFLFGNKPEQWSTNEARHFIHALKELI